MAADWFLRPRGSGRRVAPAIFVPDGELGFSGLKGSQGTETLVFPDGSFRLAHYSLNAFGFRVVPANPETADECILLMGDSIAFGLGVADDETTAALLQKEFPRLRVINLGFIGWGAHQALRLLEIGRDKEILAGCTRVRPYLFTQFNHARRAGGRMSYDLSGPNYVLRDGRLSHQGPFHSLRVSSFINSYFTRSGLASRALAAYLGTDQPLPGEAERFRAILSRIDDTLQERYHSPLTVLYFSLGQAPNPNDQALLENTFIRKIYFDELAAPSAGLYLPDHAHPNPEGHKRIAALIGASITNSK